MGFQRPSEVAAIFIAWLRGPPLYPDYFPSYDATDKVCVTNTDNCLDPARVVIFSFIGHW